MLPGPGGWVECPVEGSNQNDCFDHPGLGEMSTGSNVSQYKTSKKHMSRCFGDTSEQVKRCPSRSSVKAVWEKTIGSGVLSQKLVLVSSLSRTKPQQFGRLNSNLVFTSPGMTSASFAALCPVPPRPPGANCSLSCSGGAAKPPPACARTRSVRPSSRKRLLPPSPPEPPEPILFGKTH